MLAQEALYHYPVLCLCVFVNLTQTRVSWEEEPQLRKYFNRIGMYASLLSLFLRDDGSKSAVDMLSLGHVRCGHAIPRAGGHP